MTPAAVMIERLGRLLLLVCTVLGVAALHTVGHASLTDLDHHGAVVVTTAHTVVQRVAAVSPGEDDGCDGDGCSHPAAGPSSGQGTSRWWEVCLAVLSVLAVGLLGARLSTSAGSAAPVGLTRARLRRPSVRARPVGLALATIAVIRT